MTYFDQLYKLNIMETKSMGSFEVTRVPTGWVLKSTTMHFAGYPANGSESMVFVPYIEKNLVSNPIIKEKITSKKK
jgi:hypothetical protein